MKKMWKLACLAALTVGVQAGATQVAADDELPVNTAPYHTDFDAFDSSTQQLSDWSNGSVFNNTWRPQNVGFNDGIMTLTIDQDDDGKYYGGEWRTLEYQGFGTYSVSMKPFKNPGVVSSFFTYTGPSDGTPWDEIDIEFLGKDTTKVQFNYYTDGVGEHEFLYDLGFDASEEFHTYAFDWAPDKITWYVDGKLVHEATENIPTHPGKIMTNAWNGIGVDDWLQPYDGKVPLTAYYDWVDYQPAAESSEPNPANPSPTVGPSDTPTISTQPIGRKDQKKQAKKLKKIVKKNRKKARNGSKKFKKITKKATKKAKKASKKSRWAMKKKIKKQKHVKSSKIQRP